MRERERNLKFRRVRFHLFENDPFLTIEIPTGTDFVQGVVPALSSAYTRLNLKEIEKLNRFLDRAELAIFLRKRALQK